MSLEKNDKTENAVETSAKPTTVEMKNDDVEEIVLTTDDEAVDNVIKLSKKYKFEGKVIDTIDMTGIETVNGEMAQRVEKLYRKNTKNVTASPELTIDYAMAMASVLTGLPVEFFKRLNLKDLTKMKNRIVNFLYAD